MKLRLIALIISMLTATTAYAQDAERLARSDKHYEEGSRLYHAGDYPGAVLELKAGYDLAPHPIFLVNIALAYSKLQNWQEAAGWGRRAAEETGLAAKPNAQTAARAEAWSLHAGSESLAARIAAQTVAEDQKVTDQVVVAPTPSPARRFGTLGWVGLGIGGAGLLSAGGAGIIGALLQDDRDAFEAAAASGNRADYELYRDRIDNGQNIGQILLFGGAGLFVVGGVLFLVDAVTVEAQVAATSSGPSAQVVLLW